MGAIATINRSVVTPCLVIVMMALLLVGAGPLNLPIPVSAAQLQQRSLTLSNNIPDGTATYRIAMDIATPGMLGSVRVDFCSNTSILTDPCTAPVGFDVSAATIASQSGASGFIIDPATTANSLLLSRVPAAVGATTVVFELANVHNASTAGSSFARYYTYASQDGSGSETDSGALGYSLNGSFGLTTEVPPYLTMCVGTVIVSSDCSNVTGSFLQMGDFSSGRANTGQTQTVVATNAASGYSLYIKGNTMTSGNNVLPAMASPSPSLPGERQFGINLVANTNPQSGANPAGAGTGMPAADYGQADRFMYHSGDVVATAATVEDYRKYTVTYLVNISRDQPAGIYSSTFSFVGLGNF